MKKSKKFIAILLFVVMILSSCPITAFSATAPAAPSKPSFTSTTSTITLKWKKVSGAAGYDVFKYDASKKKYVKLSSTNNLSYKASSLKAGTTYSYAVKSYKVAKTKKLYSSYSPKLNATTLPSKPVVKATPSTKSVTLSWSKVTGAKNYTVYKYTASTKKYTKLATTTALSYKVSSLSENTTYSYAVLATKVLDSKSYNSAKSSLVKVTTTIAKPAVPANVKASNITSNSAKISFDKASNANKYYVEYSKSSSFSSATVKSTTNNYYTISNLNDSSKYYYRVYSSRTVNGKTVSSNYSATKSFTTTAAYTDTLSKVDETKTYQTIEGFGASGAWWAQRVGRWTDEGALTKRDENEALWTPAQTREALKYLYDKEDGIGLNIYRYNVGTDSYKDTTIENKWERTEGFLESVDENGKMTYNWDKDKSAMNTLSVVRDLAGDDLKITLFCNSPPTQLTENGLACCDDKGVDYWVGNGGSVSGTRYYLYHQNLPDNAKAYMQFANFLTDVADHFENDLGYDVMDVSPVNEPQTAWAWSEWGGTKHMSQEGCHYTPVGMSKLAAYCAIAGENKPYKFSMFDSGAADGANENDLNCSSIKYLNSLYSYGSTVKDENGTTLTDSVGNKTFANINKNYYTNVSLHSYWSNKDSKKEFNDYVLNKYPNVKTFTFTEYCQMTGDGSNGVTEWYPNMVWNDEKNDYEDRGWFDITQELKNLESNINLVSIKPGVQLARIMYEDFTVCNSSEWDWWTACSGGYYPDGLVYINYQNPDDVQTSKRLWAMGNYSKFIHEGATRVDITEAQTDLLSTAWKNKDGSLVIVYINQTDNDMTTNVKASNYKTSSTYVTSADMDLENVSNTAYSIDNSVSIPSQSVVTVVLK